MSHLIARVTGVEYLGGHALRVRFDDGLERVIDFLPVLGGSMFSPLRDREIFSRVRIDPECHTLVWPNGADFDPATLHDWPSHAEALASKARGWAHAKAR